MVGLLDLPPELREPIFLDVVLDTVKTQPAQPLSWSGFFNEGYQWVIGGELWDDESVHGFSKPLKRHAMSLLQINRQIRAEVIEVVLRKLNQRTIDAKLDIIFQQVSRRSALDLWATWLSAPFPAFHINTVHAQVRVFQVEESVPAVHMYPWDDMKDCASWIDSRAAHMLLSLVATSLRIQAGSASVHESQRSTPTSRDQPSYRTIQKLVVDIPVDPDIPSSREGLVRCSNCPGAPSMSNGEFFCMIPSGRRAALMFAKSLHEKLLKTFNDVAHSIGDNTELRMIFESVGIIDLNVQGRLFGRVNLSQILATVPRRERWFYTDLTRTEFFTWKRAAEYKRKAAGFDILNPSVQEHHLLGAAGLICSILAARDGSLLGEATESSDDHVQPAGQPASGERVAFTAKALLVQEDGRRVPGDATFYCPSSVVWARRHIDLDYHPQHFASDHDHPWERPEKDELVLFEGDAIVFPEYPPETIISGEVILYGRAEEDITEHAPDSV